MHSLPNDDARPPLRMIQLTSGSVCSLDSSRLGVTISRQSTPARHGLYIMYDPPFRELRSGHCARMENTELEGGSWRTRHISYIPPHFPSRLYFLVCVHIKRAWLEAQRSNVLHTLQEQDVFSFIYRLFCNHTRRIIDYGRRFCTLPRGVGLSDPNQSASRRRILEIIDRMRATG